MSRSIPKARSTGPFPHQWCPRAWSAFAAGSSPAHRNGPRRPVISATLWAGAERLVVIPIAVVGRSDFLMQGAMQWRRYDIDAAGASALAASSRTSPAMVLGGAARSGSTIACSARVPTKLSRSLSFAISLILKRGSIAIGHPGVSSKFHGYGVRNRDGLLTYETAGNDALRHSCAEGRIGAQFMNFSIQVMNVCCTTMRAFAAR